MRAAVVAILAGLAIIAGGGCGQSSAGDDEVSRIMQEAANSAPPLQVTPARFERIATLPSNDSGSDDEPAPTGTAEPGRLLEVPNDLTQFTDDFEDALLDPRWNVFNPAVFSLTEGAGALQLAPQPGVAWRDGQRGPFVYQVLSGNFRMTTRVHVRLLTDPSAVPQQDNAVGGLMVRDPRADLGTVESHAIVIAGTSQPALPLAVETMNVVDGATISSERTPWPSGDADLRLCRLGGEVRVYQRPVESETWALAATYDRADFPEFVQAGIVAHDAAGDQVAITATFDEVVFERIATAEDCTARSP